MKPRRQHQDGKIGYIAVKDAAGNDIVEPIKAGLTQKRIWTPGEQEVILLKLLYIAMHAVLQVCSLGSLWLRHTQPIDLHMT